MTLPVDDLAFEASFLGFPVWRLRAADLAAEAVALARRKGVGLISCRLPETAAVAGLEKAGFQLVEVLVTLSRPVRGRDMPENISLSDHSDGEAEACARIGRSAFVFDRFHADPRIDNAAADALKGSWVANSVRGRADCVLLHREEEGLVSGFNACLFNAGAREAVIDLIGIDPAFQRRGIGSRLIDGMDAHYAGRAETLRLGTQLANEASIAFYLRNGFREVKREQTWHWQP